jgi:hypothetical protein
VTHVKAIRWYNPKLEDFEWREVPKSDEEALVLLSYHASCERYVEVYEDWRTLGAPIVVALIRAGEAAHRKSGRASLAAPALSLCLHHHPRPGATKVTLISGS